jgi:HAD superfamily hydrolase (TIGR01457 family)
VGDRVLDRYDALLVDLDGVVYRGNEAIPGAADLLGAVRDAGRRVVFLTNNSSRTPDEVAGTLRAMGIPAGSDEVVTSALATAAMLRTGDPGGARTAFVVGRRGIREALAAIGVQVLDSTAERADLVVIGWDPQSTYGDLRTAALLVQRGARLIATNADASYPAPDGLWPGAGALLAAVVTTTNASPAVAGKPAAPMFDAAAEVAGATRPLVVGDRLDTDIAGAHAMGWDSMLVFTGASKPRDLAFAAALPTYVGTSIAAAGEEIPRCRLRTAAAGERAHVTALALKAGLPAPTEAAGPGDALVAVEVPVDDSETEAVLAAATVFSMGDVAVIRSVVVDPRARGRGVGTLVVAEALQRARGGGAAAAYALTESAAPFFERMGFARIGRADLPPAVRHSEHATGACGTAEPFAFDLHPSAGGGTG